MTGTVLCSIGVFVICFLVYGYVSNYFFTTSNYQLTSTYIKGDSVRIIMLADLHGMKFGKQNSRLIRSIKNKKPDIICIAGDMIVKDGKGIVSCLDLCKCLTEICPVYYSLGNHEIRYEGQEKFLCDLIKNRVHVLDDKQEEINVKGTNFCITGLTLQENHYQKVWEKSELTLDDIQKKLKKPKEGAYNILLAHNPDYFEWYGEWGADLVCAGHVHGGIMILPILGGVISPALRLFPHYDSGMFQLKHSTMILSRGLGTHHIRLRFFNVPEVSMITIEKC